MKKTAIVLLFVIAFSSISMAQDTLKINSKTSNLELDNLQNQATKYLVYLTLPDGNIGDISIWNRTVELSANEIIINQSWKNQEKKRTRTIFSVNDKQTFLPKFQKSISGEGVIEAYDFYEDKIVGSDTTVNNSKSDFALDFENNNLPFNWELDLEFFQMLPYQLLRTFEIYFYHPGGKSGPKEYTYTVIGEESLASSYGSIDTWVVQIFYDKEKGNSATFWIRKKDKVVVKMIEKYGPITRIKQLM